MHAGDGERGTGKEVLGLFFSRNQPSPDNFRGVCQFCRISGKLIGLTPDMARVMQEPTRKEFQNYLHVVRLQRTARPAGSPCVESSDTENVKIFVDRPTSAPKGLPDLDAALEAPFRFPDR